MAQSQVSAKKQQELQQQYTTYKNNLQQLAERIGNVEQETEEHKLVLETLKPLPDSRKCFRMINGVLVERTVKDVMPALQTNWDGLRKVLDELVKQYKRQQEDMENVGSSFIGGYFYVWPRQGVVEWSDLSGSINVSQRKPRKPLQEIMVSKENEEPKRFTPGWVGASHALPEPSDDPYQQRKASALCMPLDAALKTRLDGDDGRRVEEE
ncbi:MAG: hypothetical protein LQ350_005609 [Teloschistes chrysophthalmus]|nr:MAG: hypothetical protein LQ350_005609 [Niorma chrysophthalma]